jgi:hypothetical protein
MIEDYFLKFLKLTDQKAIDQWFAELWAQVQAKQDISAMSIQILVRDLKHDLLRGLEDFSMHRQETTQMVMDQEASFQAIFERVAALIHLVKSLKLDKSSLHASLFWLWLNHLLALDKGASQAYVFKRKIKLIYREMDAVHDIDLIIQNNLHLLKEQKQAGESWQEKIKRLSYVLECLIAKCELEGENPFTQEEQQGLLLVLKESLESLKAIEIAHISHAQALAFLLQDQESFSLSIQTLESAVKAVSTAIAQTKAVQAQQNKQADKIEQIQKYLASADKSVEKIIYICESQSKLSKQ